MKTRRPKIPDDVKETLDKVYKNYMTKTPFELVVLTHSELPWQEARKGLTSTEPCNSVISDKTIVAYYGQKENTPQ